jgi:glycosyltransferase involved in cell wall biosynthesis
LAPTGPLITVVVPFFNEEENILPLHRRLRSALEQLNYPFEFLYVNDGSSDATGRILDGLQDENSCVRALHLSRNFGHQAAVSAGLDHARGDAVIVMDGDLQDPPEVLAHFIQKWQSGYDVVYAIRTKRKEHLLKRLAYHTFYRLLNAISDIDIPLDSGDFCVMDRKILEALRGLPERIRFVRGLRTFVGFKQTGLPYERSARAAGRPKYTLRKLIGLAVDGLVSFSSYPLHLVTYLGLITIIISMGLGLWVILDAILNRSTPRGWASTLIVVLFMGAIQLLSLGIIGEYIRRIYLETKGRPTYIVRQSGRERRPNHLATGLPHLEPEKTETPQMEE